MKDGFIKVAAATPAIHVAEPAYNAEQIGSLMEEAMDKDVQLLVFPELCITGYTCGDLFLQDTLLAGAEKALSVLVEKSIGSDMVIVAGLPVSVRAKLYNIAVLFQNGKLLGAVPKGAIPTYSEFYEGRHFTSGEGMNTEIMLCGQSVPFGTKQLFVCEEEERFCIAAEICEDLWGAIPPSCYHALAGATVIVNLSASNETTGKSEYRRELVKSQSARLFAGYIYADAGEGESTTDTVFAGPNIIAENGTVLAESERFTTGLCVTEIDLQRVNNERRRVTPFADKQQEGYQRRYFSLQNGTKECMLTRTFEPFPFVPSCMEERNRRCEEITRLQAESLKKRLLHTGLKSAVVGISGGLDSTLALLVTCQAFELAGYEKKNIYTITMPCFGTTDRTYRNAISLAKELGTTVKEIPIAESVRKHFADIGHSEEVHDLTYENAQARERTQVLMDYAGMVGGLVVGTGDLSELVLGWATYNGDHMSMYGVNGSVPKTLVRYLVSYFADVTESEGLATVLRDIVDTPVSPELLPPSGDGRIAQKTEDLVGPYELHDFFLYYVLRFGFMPKKVFRLAKSAFAGKYEDETIYHWLEVFYKRFFSQQFKRSCLPDGPKIGSVAVSPRGDLRMPSDAVANAWLTDLAEIKPR
ncbi:MAG: NAD(+) synthase [Lachnospiraceae bacterium]|nr:NAD(+) synthase [Lachnospiraceae bacterium]